jgi:hypothetical protein
MFLDFLFQYFNQLPYKSSFNPKTFNPPSIFILNDKELRVPSNQSSFNPITKYLTQQQFINIRNCVIMHNQSINHCFKHELAIHMSVDIKKVRLRLNMKMNRNQQILCLNNKLKKQRK